MNNRANSPAVIPCRNGTGYSPMKELCAGYSKIGPSIATPSIGFGRSSTTNGMPDSAAACIAYAIVATYV